MPELRYNKNHHAGATPEARISNRLRNSGGGADVVVHKGDGPTRTITNVHHAAAHVPVRDVRDRSIRDTAKD